MTKGRGRFEYYLAQLDELLVNAAKTDNPAVYLYQHDARTGLFMLEGLSKLYAGMHNKKIFSKAEDKFKQIEDLLGAVDYYDGFAKDFLADEEMPSTIRMAMEQRRDQKLAVLNEVLKKQNWLSAKKPRTTKIRKKMAGACWKEPVKEMRLIRDFYAASVRKINKFYESTGEHFTDIESQVHALRRKLRWLSIYPQALQGAVEFTDQNMADADIAKYLTPEIVNSPFNKLPAENGNEVILLLEKNYFLALSYMIASLGKLKDAGLRIIATAEAVQVTQFTDRETSLKRAFELNKKEGNALEEILQQAKDLCVPYFEKKMIDKIIAATPYPVSPENEMTAEPEKPAEETA